MIPAFEAELIGNGLDKYVVEPVPCKCDNCKNASDIFVLVPVDKENDLKRVDLKMTLQFKQSN